MELILFYALFALTTAITAQYELIGPVMRELAISNPEDNLIQSKFLSHIVFFLVSLLFAPIVLIPTLVPSIGVSFKLMLLESLTG